MIVIQHQKFLIKPKKYYFLGYLKTADTRFSGKTFLVWGLPNHERVDGFANKKTIKTLPVVSRSCKQHLPKRWNETQIFLNKGRFRGANFGFESVRNFNGSGFYHQGREMFLYQASVVWLSPNHGRTDVFSNKKNIKALPVISHFAKRWGRTQRVDIIDIKTFSSYQQKWSSKLTITSKNFIISINENKMGTLKGQAKPVVSHFVNQWGRSQRFIRNSLKGILLVNFPEKEKNFLIKNLAAENKIPLISQSASLLLKDSRNLDDLLGVDDPIQILFDKVKTCIPCICFINNLDRIGKQRYEQEAKSLDWLTNSIPLLIDHNFIGQRPFGALNNRKLSMDLQVTNYYYRLPNWLFKITPTTYPKTNIIKVKQFGFYNNTDLFHKENLVFYSQLSSLRNLASDKSQTNSPNSPLKELQEIFRSHPLASPTVKRQEVSRNKQRVHDFADVQLERFDNPVNWYPTSLAYKLWVLYKNYISPKPKNFSQTLSTKVKPILKKSGSKIIISKVSVFKMETPFSILRLKQQTAEKKLFKFFPISHKRDFVYPDRQKILMEKQALLSPFIYYNKQKSAELNLKKPKVNLKNIASTMWVRDEKKTQGHMLFDPVINKHSLGRFETGFESSVELLSTNNLNLTSQNIKFLKKEKPLIKPKNLGFASSFTLSEAMGKYPMTFSLRTNTKMEQNKNNSFKITETDIIKRTALLKFLQILDGFHTSTEKRKYIFFPYKYFAGLKKFNSPTIFHSIASFDLKRQTKSVILKLPETFESKPYQLKINDKHFLSIKNLVAPVILPKKANKDTNIVTNNLIQNNICCFPYGILKTWKKLPKLNQFQLNRKNYSNKNQMGFLQFFSESHNIQTNIPQFKPWWFGKRQTTNALMIFQIKKPSRHSLSFRGVVSNTWRSNGQVPNFQKKSSILKNYKSCVRGVIKTKSFNALENMKYQLTALLNVKNESKQPLRDLADAKSRKLDSGVIFKNQFKKITRSKKLQEIPKYGNYNRVISNKNYLFSYLNKKPGRVFLEKIQMLLNTNTFEFLLKTKRVFKWEINLKNQPSNKSLNLLCVWPSYIEDILGPFNLNDSGSYILPEYFQLLGHGPKFKKQGITLFASTNNLTTLDKALLRPGRFDTIINFSHSFSSIHQPLKMLKHSPPSPSSILSLRLELNINPSLTQNNQSYSHKLYNREQEQINLFFNNNLLVSSLLLSNLTRAVQDKFSSHITTFDKPDQSSPIKAFIDVSIFLQYKLWWNVTNGKSSWLCIDQKGLIQKQKTSVSSSSKLKTFKPSAYDIVLIFKSKIHKIKDLGTSPSLRKVRNDRQSLTCVLISILQMIYLKFFYNFFQFSMIFKTKLTNRFKNWRSIENRSLVFEPNSAREVLISKTLTLGLPKKLNSLDFPLKIYSVPNPNVSSLLNYIDKTTHLEPRKNLMDNIYTKQDNLFLKSNRNLLFSTGDFDYKAYTEKKFEIILAQPSIRNSFQMENDHACLSSIRVYNNNKQRVRDKQAYASLFKKSNSASPSKRFTATLGPPPIAYQSVAGNPLKPQEEPRDSDPCSFSKFENKQRVHNFADAKSWRPNDTVGYNPTMKSELGYSTHSVGVATAFLDQFSKVWKAFQATAFKNDNQNHLRLVKYNKIYQLKKIQFQQQSFFKLHPFTSLMLKRWPEITKSNKLKQYLKVSLVKNIVPQLNFQGPPMVSSQRKRWDRSQLDQKNKQNSLVIQDSWFLNLDKESPYSQISPDVSHHAKRWDGTQIYQNLYSAALLIPTHLSLLKNESSKIVATDRLFSNYESYLFKKLATNCSLNINCLQIYSKLGSACCFTLGGAMGWSLTRLKKKSFEFLYDKPLFYKNWISNLHLIQIRKQFKKIPRKTSLSYKYYNFQNLCKIKYYNIKTDQLKMNNHVILLKNSKEFLVSDSPSPSKRFEATLKDPIRWNPNLKKQHDFVKTPESFLKTAVFDDNIKHGDILGFQNIKTNTTPSHLSYQRKQWGERSNYKMCQLDVTFFLLTFYTMFFEKIQASPDVSRGVKQSSGIQPKKTLNTIKIFMPYKSSIFSHFLLSQGEAYGFSCKNFEILIYNKFKNFL